MHHESPWHKNYVQSRAQPESITSFRTSTMWHVPDTHSHETVTFTTSSRWRTSYAGISIKGPCVHLWYETKGSGPHQSKEAKSETSSTTPTTSSVWKLKGQMPVDYHRRFPECRLSVLPFAIPKVDWKQTNFKSYQYFCHVVFRHSWVQSRKHYEHGTLLHHVTPSLLSLFGLESHFERSKLVSFRVWGGQRYPEFSPAHCKGVLMWTQLAIWFLTFCYRNKPRHLWHKPYTSTMDIW